PRRSARPLRRHLQARIQKHRPNPPRPLEAAWRTPLVAARFQRWLGRRRLDAPATNPHRARYRPQPVHTRRPPVSPLLPTPYSLTPTPQALQRYVEITFDCLPLRSISRMDIPIDASPRYRQRCENIKAAIEHHGSHNSYYLYNAQCVFHLTNDA